jgi:hypothetical protein
MVVARGFEHRANKFSAVSRVWRSPSCQKSSARLGNVPQLESGNASPVHCAQRLAPLLHHPQPLLMWRSGHRGIRRFRCDACCPKFPAIPVLHRDGSSCTAPLLLQPVHSCSVHSRQHTTADMVPHRRPAKLRTPIRQSCSHGSQQRRTAY